MNSYAQNHSNKLVGSTFYYPSTDSKWQDSTKSFLLLNSNKSFKGYIVFEIHKKIDEKFYMYDSSYYQADLFFVNNIGDILDGEKYFYDNIEGFYSDYAHSDEARDFTDEKDTVKLKSKDFMAFKNFYLHYENNSENNSNEIFLNKRWSTQMFKKYAQEVWKKDDSNISYLVFDSEFDAAVIGFDAYYLNKSGDRVNVGNIMTFLPLSKERLFKPVEDRSMFENNFVKDTLPECLLK